MYFYSGGNSAFLKISRLFPPKVRTSRHQERGRERERLELLHSRKQLSIWQAEDGRSVSELRVSSLHYYYVHKHRHGLILIVVRGAKWTKSIFTWRRFFSCTTISAENYYRVILCPSDSSSSPSDVRECAFVLPRLWWHLWELFNAICHPPDISSIFGRLDEVRG